VSFFCAKSEVVQTKLQPQADRGALQAIANFTDCKVLKRNAARLHNSAMGVLQQRKAEVPAPIGRKNEKHRNS